MCHVGWIEWMDVSCCRMDVMCHVVVEWMTCVMLYNGWDVSCCTMDGMCHVVGWMGCVML